MAPLAINHSDKYTYKDYLTWPDDERWELIRGRAYNMTPAPSRRHQEILVELTTQFGVYFRNSPCKLYVAPFDVRLLAGDEKDDDIENVVQPDLVVVCDRSKLDDRGCKGSPDLVVEILSLSTGRKDRKEKFLLYEETGVKEYWLIDPEMKTVEIFQRGEDGRFGRPDVYSEEDDVSVNRFEELVVELGRVFRE